VSGRVCVWGCYDGGARGLARLDMSLAGVPLGPRSLFAAARAATGTEERMGIDDGGGAEEHAPCFDMATCPDERWLAVATGQGDVLKGGWGGPPAPPRRYLWEEPWAAACRLRAQAPPGPGEAPLRPSAGGVECRAVACSGLVPEVLAAGYSDGSVAVFHRRSSAPRCAFPPRGPAGAVRALAWSPVHAGLLYALDAQSTLVVYDLAGDRSRPAATHAVAREGSYATCLSVSAPGGGGGGGALAVGYSDGATRVHPLCAVAGRPAGEAEAASLLADLAKISGAHLVS